MIAEMSSPVSCHRHPMNTQKTNQIDATRWLALGSLGGLIALGLAWEMWLAPIRPGGSLLALKVLLCLLLFAACALHVRLRLKNALSPVPITEAV